MITISKRARNRLQAQGAGPLRFVRLRVKTGGCAGMTYDAELAATMAADEEVIFADQGITVVSNQESIRFLEGLIIDYSEDLISAGYRFSNASNDTSCGCGASFSLTGFPQPLQGGDSCGN